jgi:hypothetical protein
MKASFISSTVLIPDNSSSVKRVSGLKVEKWPPFDSTNISVGDSGLAECKSVCKTIEDNASVG